jgi:hypothetical protein
MAGRRIAAAAFSLDQAARSASRPGVRTRQARRLTSRLDGSSPKGNAVASLISDRVRPISRSSKSDICANSDIVRRAALTRAGQVRMRQKAFAAWEANVNEATKFASYMK